MTTPLWIFLGMSVICAIIILFQYWSWFEQNPTTEEIIQEAIDKHDL